MREQYIVFIFVCSLFVELSPHDARVTQLLTSSAQLCLVWLFVVVANGVIVVIALQRVLLIRINFHIALNTALPGVHPAVGTAPRSLALDATKRSKASLIGFATRGEVLETKKRSTFAHRH